MSAFVGIAMGYLVPQLAHVGHNYDGRRRLPTRLERVAVLLADYTSIRETARRARVSCMSVQRLKQQPAFMARVQHLQRQAAERVSVEAPLALRGNRLALLDKHARKLAEDLAKNDYKETIAVNKQGEPITGFDRGRAAELTKVVMAIDELAEGKRSSTIVEAQQVGVQVSITSAEVVTKVQALLSRAQPAEGQAHPQGTPQGVEGGTIPLGNATIDDGGSRQGPQQNSDAKEILDAEYEERGE